MIEALLICLAPLAVDGDTVRCGNSQTNIRLFGVQAPERSHTDHPASRASLQRAVQGGLVCTPKGTSYNRIVAICKNASGVDIGRWQIRTNQAVEWCRYSKNHYGTCPSP